MLRHRRDGLNGLAISSVCLNSTWWKIPYPCPHNYSDKLGSFFFLRPLTHPHSSISNTCLFIGRTKQDRERNTTNRKDTRKTQSVKRQTLMRTITSFVSKGLGLLSYHSLFSSCLLPLRSHLSFFFFLVQLCLCVSVD